MYLCYYVKKYTFIYFMSEICRSEWPEIRRFFSFQKQGNLCAPALQDVSLSDKTLLVYFGQKPSCPAPVRII